MPVGEEMCLAATSRLRYNSFQLQGMPAEDIAEITTQAQIAAEVGPTVDPALDADTPWSDRRPYSQRTVYHTPPRFSSAIIQSIRHGAAKLFKVCWVCWDYQDVQNSTLLAAQGLVGHSWSCATCSRVGKQTG